MSQQWLRYYAVEISGETFFSGRFVNSENCAVNASGKQKTPYLVGCVLHEYHIMDSAMPIINGPYADVEKTRIMSSLPDHHRRAMTPSEEIEFFKGLGVDRPK